MECASAWASVSGIATRTAPAPSAPEPNPSGSMNGRLARVCANVLVSHRSQSFFLCAQMGTSEHAMARASTPPPPPSPSADDRRFLRVKKSPSPSTNRTWPPVGAAAA